MTQHLRDCGFYQWRLPCLRVTWTDENGLTVWFHVGGRKPLAHLNALGRLLHLPSIRWRVYPHPLLKQARP